MNPLQEVLLHLSHTDKPFQLVKHIDDVPTDKIKYPMWGEKKYDGVFCAVLLHRGNQVAISRTGKHFYDEVNDLLYPYIPHDREETVLIGELINTQCSLEVLSGLVNPNRVQAWDIDQRDLMKGIDIIFHDILTFADVLRGSSPVPFIERRLKVDALPCNTYKAQGRMLHSQAEFDLYAAEEIAAGGEGIVGKQLDANYEAGHKGYRVVKKVRDLHVDLKCLAVETGKGKRTGQIARLQFKYKGKLFWADLGEGWTDEKRIALTECWQLATTNALKMDHPHNPIGKIFHVKALQESSKGVLRLPKVMELRVDKLEEDVT